MPDFAAASALRYQKEGHSIAIAAGVNGLSPSRTTEKQRVFVIASAPHCGALESLDRRSNLQRKDSEECAKRRATK
jgi:hypothetical protein